MIQIFKKKILPCLAGILFFCACLTACNSDVPIFPSFSLQKEQRSFDSYTKELFAKELQKNTINLHYTLSEPENFGIDSHQISLGSLSRDSANTSLAALENISRALSDFDYDALNTKQRLTYDILEEHCKRELSAADFYYYEEPLRPTTGTQSELPVLLAEYNFSNACDVTDYLALLLCTEDYFEQISLFEQEKAREGLFMADFAADTVIKACESFAASPETNFLIDTFDSRIDALPDISEEKKIFYKEKNCSLVQNIVIPSYEKLRNTLASLKGSGKNNAGLCNYPKGKAYYEFLVRSNTGSEKTVEELKEATKRQRQSDLDSLRKLMEKNPNLANTNVPALDSENPEEILKHLLSAMQKDFYPAKNDSFEINYVHPSLENTLAPAFYLTAPIDDTSRNVIYLNRKNAYSGMQLFTTLAHEGYPGHLYQTTGSYQAGLAPIRALLNYPGYVEGWATYVELLSYHYAGLNDELADLLMYHQSALLSLYATIDMGIHYDGWNLTDVTMFLGDYHVTDPSLIQDIYALITEEPSHYLKYYIGYLEFLELKDFAKKEFGERYLDREFHQAVIRIGPAPFPILRKYLSDFYGS